MSRPLAYGFSKVIKDRPPQPRPKLKANTEPAEYDSPLSKVAMRARQQHASSPKTPRGAHQPMQPPLKKPVKDTVQTPKKRVRGSDELPSAPPTKKHARQGADHADGPSPASKKRVNKKAQEARQLELLQQEDDDVNIEPPAQDIIRPSWADPLVELNARASQASRVQNKYQDVYFGAHMGMRLFGPSASPDRVISYAVAMHDVPIPERPANLAIGGHDDDFLEYIHHALPLYFPNWDNVVPILKREPELITKLGSYYEKVGGKTRSDDLVRLKQKIIWAAGIEDPKGVLADKSNRGFHDLDIARLLCPKSKLDRFDADPEAFCEAVIDGDEPLRSCDWWAGLYDLDRAKPGHFRPGFLMSEFLIWCYLILFCSADSAAFQTMTGKKKKGQPSLSKKYNLQHVTLFSILYTACLARHTLTTNKDWSESDGAWNVHEFVDSVFDFASKNVNWSNNLCAWWTRRIYGDTKHEEMSQAEFEETAFFHALNYEGDGNEAEDEFDDLPCPRKKPRAVGPAKPRAVGPAKPRAVGPAKPRVVGPVKRPVKGPAKKATSRPRHATSPPSTRQSSPRQPSTRPPSPPHHLSRHPSPRQPSPRQPSPDSDLYYNSPGPEDEAESLCRPFDDNSDDDILRSNPLNFDQDTFNEDDVLPHVDATVTKQRSAMDWDTHHGEDGEDANMDAAQDTNPKNAQEVANEAEDENTSEVKAEREEPAARKTHKQGTIEPERDAGRDKSLPPGLTKEDLLASLLALSEEGDPELLATLAQLKLKHAPKRTSQRRKNTAGKN